MRLYVWVVEIRWNFLQSYPYFCIFFQVGVTIIICVTLLCPVFFFFIINLKYLKLGHLSTFNLYLLKLFQYALVVVKIQSIFRREIDFYQYVSWYIHDFFCFKFINAGVFFDLYHIRKRRIRTNGTYFYFFPSCLP